MSQLTTLLNAAPGVYVRTATAGGAPVALALHDNVYAFVEVPSDIPTDVFPLRKPVLLNNFSDYQAFFGNSIPSSASHLTCYNWIRLLFRNAGTAGQKFVIRVPGPNTRGELYTFTPASGYVETTYVFARIKLANFDELNFDVASDDTAGTIGGKIKAAIENSSLNTVIYVRRFNPTTGELVFSPRFAGQQLSLKIAIGPLNVALGPDLAPVTSGPLVTERVNEIDYLEAINTSFNLETDLPGFLCAPAAFAHQNAAERFVIGQAMEQFASDPEVQWAAIIDSAPTHPGPLESSTSNSWKLSGSTDTNIDKLNLRFEQVFDELNSYISPQGHSFVIAPYAIDFEGFVVPGSAYLAGIALLAMKTDGIAAPPAGVRYQIRGIRRLTAEYNKAQHTLANNNQINLALVKPRWGAVVFGSRTRSSSSFFRFINSRVILNSYIATLKRGFDEVLFRAPDGRGAVFNDILAVAENISQRFYQGGAFYGPRPEDAYFLKCDEENNSPENIENGSIVLQCWVVVSPTLERLLIEVIRVPLGQLAGVIARVQESGG